DAWLERARTLTRVYTTLIDISGYADVRRDALLAHATQVDPESPFWFGLPPEVARTVHPVDEYVLARTAPGMPDPDPPAAAPAEASPEVVEDDLFAGVHDPATR
ncbi:MAG TPA: hypothetical protein VKR22_01225, partial [Acidimicrobiales bacterium]|nr:hypothetical protein [Acidimicrobiales bacterium]